MGIVQKKTTTIFKWGSDNRNLIMSEADTQKQILEYLNRKGIFCWRSNSGRKHNLIFGRKGSADITGLLKDGKRLEIEVKDLKGKQSPDQIEFQRMITLNNGIYILARSVEDVYEIIEKYNCG